MANCENCGSSLPGSKTTCLYCGTRNSIDLHAISDYTVVRPHSQRWCPCCDATELETIDVGRGNPFYIEKCHQCGGLFFDNGELEVILEQEVSNVHHIDRDKLKQLIQEVSDEKYDVVYRACPICGDMMQRKVFAKQSGVIVDQCAKHGMWLDSGELYRLLEWKKSGGVLLGSKESPIKDSLRTSVGISNTTRHFSSPVVSRGANIDAAAGLLHMLSGLL